MFREFTHRHTPCTVDGVADTVVLTRDSRSSSIINREYLYTGLFAQQSPVRVGSLVTVEDDVFFVQTSRSTAERDRYCGMIKTNAVIEVQRYSRDYDGRDNPVGDPYFMPVASSVPAFAKYVTAKIRQDDIGLLPTTSYVLQVQKGTDVKEPTELLQPDRILLNGRPYQVDAIDDIRYPGLLYIQLSEDNIR